MVESVFVNEQEWQENIDGWEIVDCGVRDRNILSILMRETVGAEEASRMDDHDKETKAVQIQLDRAVNETRVYLAGHVIEFNRPRLGVCLKPLAQDLIVARNSLGTAFASGSGQYGMEHISPEGEGKSPWRIVTIDGYAYAVCHSRTIYKRVEIGRWVQFSNKGIPKRKTHFTTTIQALEYGASLGFNDLDGPDESLLYAVGGHGDVWRFDGERWTQCDFPSNEQLATVTVAPDGKVYISGEGGNLWVGENDRWQKVHEGYSSVLCNDSVWFDGMLWLSSDYQLRVWDGEQLRRPQHNGQDVVHAGHMDARDGLLAIASLSRVDTFDGTDWHTLVKPY